MINNLGINFEFDLMTDLSIGRKYLRKLDQVPPSIWEAVEEFVLNLAKERATNITRYNVSDTTAKWRSRKAKSKNPKVETHRGEFKNVMPGRRVGKRTSTFVDDLRESKLPGVEYGISSEGTNITNGTFKYQILAENFAHNYPISFLAYLISRNIVPDGGYLALDSAQEEQVLDMLEIEVSKYLGLEWEKLQWR